MPNIFKILIPIALFAILISAFQIDNETDINTRSNPKVTNVSKHHKKIKQPKASKVLIIRLAANEKVVSIVNNRSGEVTRFVTSTMDKNDTPKITTIYRANGTLERQIIESKR